MFVAVWIVVAAVPFVLLGTIRLVARTTPAYVRWAEQLERRHYKAYWVILGATYALIGIGHLALPKGEPVFGVIFVGMGLVSIVKGLRGRLIVA
jgi:hypothetical protein